MEAIKKISLFIGTLICITSNLNAQTTYNTPFSVPSPYPAHDVLYGYTGIMTIMGGASPFSAALTKCGINTETPSQMLSVLGGNYNIDASTSTYGYMIADNPVLFTGGDPTSIFAGEQTSLTNSYTSNQYNTCLGYEAGPAIALTTTVVINSATYNTFSGAYAGNKIQNGYQDTYIGGNAGITDQNGRDNTFIGYNCGFNTQGVNTWIPPAHANGDFNTMCGFECGYSNIIGYANNYYGKAAGYWNEGFENCMIGGHAGNGSMGTNVDSNTFLGNYAAASIFLGDNNVIIGNSAGYHSGQNSMYGNSSYYNVFIGGQSSFSNWTGNYNITIGFGSQAYGGTLSSPTSITNAVAIGADAIVNYDNEFILGNNAHYVGIGMVGEGFPSGKLEVFQHSGNTNTIGEFVTNTDLSSATSYTMIPRPLIGLKSYIPATTSFNNVAGWFEADGLVNTHGGASVREGYAIFVPGQTVYASGLVNGGTVDIGYTFTADHPDFILDVNGIARVTGGVVPSDTILKRNLAPFKYGIKAIRNLNPYTYKYNGVGGFDTSTTYIGVIAQNLKRNVPNAVISSVITKDTVTYDTTKILNVYEEGVMYTAVNAIKEVDSAATSNFNKQQQTNDSIRTGLYPSGWGLTGNSGTTPVTNFVGTTDGAALEFKTDAQKSGWIDYTAPGNTALGYQAENSTTGLWNAALGFQALYTNTSGEYNTAVGFQALYTNNTGIENVSMGTQALYANTGSDNTAVGYIALTANTSGTDNTAVGFRSLQDNLSGQYNVGIGRDALHTATTASDNIGVGRGALYNTTGGNNVAYGAVAGLTNVSGTNNTFVGYGADFGGGATNYTNSTALGNGTTITASNQLNLGNTSVSTVQGEVNYSVYSDRRIKTNIQNNVPGLAFINKLQPVTYNLNIHQQNTMLGITDSTSLTNTDYWNHKYDIENIVFTGLIAQQVDTAAQQCGYNFSGVKKPATPSGLYGLGYTDLVMPLIKSVQQLSAKNDSLNATVDSLRNAFKNIQSCLTQLCNNGHGASRHTGGGSGNSGDSNATILNTQDVTLSGLANAPLLYQNIPNPFSTGTKINYFLPASTQGASIVFYDTYGNKIKTVELSQTGNGTLNVTPDNLTSGIYSYSLVVNGNVVDTKRMILQK